MFAGDPKIGGRYSALSPFGIVPATLIGRRRPSCSAGAARAWDTPLDGDEDGHGAGVWLGAALSALARPGATS